MLCLVPYLTPAQMMTEQQNQRTNVVSTVSSLAFRKPGPTLQSRLYTDGSIVKLQTESITWPILQNQYSEMTQDEFKELVTSAKESFDSDPNRVIVNEGGSRALDIQFDVSSPPSGATAAINAVASYIESKFSVTMRLLLPGRTQGMV